MGYTHIPVQEDEKERAEEEYELARGVLFNCSELQQMGWTKEDFEGLFAQWFEEIAHLAAA